MPSGTKRHEGRAPRLPGADTMSATRPTVSVVIPTHNNLSELTECLSSLRAQAYRSEQVLVCVDGSTDGTIEYLHGAGGGGSLKVVALTHPGNAHRGRPATRNLALGHLDSDYVWFVDSDMVLAPDALEQHLMLVERGACISQGQVVYENAGESPWAGYLDTRAYHRSPDEAVIPFTWFSAANAFVRTSHVSAIGGFDERFASYGGEDFDFAYRLAQRTGAPIINNRRAVARTVENKSIEAALAQFEEYGSENLHLLESLHPDMPRTFELQRLDSTAFTDRLFAAVLRQPFERVVDLLVRFGPTRLRNRLLNYKVVAAVWRGYRSVNTEERP